MKKYLPRIMLIWMLIILVFSGCGTNVTTEVVALPSETVSAAQVVTPTPTLTPSPSPTETSLLSWPDIEGLTLKDGTYYYKAGNPYRGKEGDIAGVTKDNVLVEGEQAGGICFTPEVCRVLLYNELDIIPEGQIKIKVIVPLDISAFNGAVKIDTFHKEGSSEITAIELICNAEVPVVSTTDAEILDSGIAGKGDTTVRLIVNRYAAQNFDPNLAYNNINLASDGTDFYDKEGYSDVFWGKELLVKNAESILTISLSVMDKYLNIDDLLTSDGKVVFMSVSRQLFS